MFSFRKSLCVAALLSAYTIPLSASQVFAGILGITTNFGSNIYNNVIYLYNETGVGPGIANDCTGSESVGMALVCPNIDISIFSLTIHYTDETTNTTHIQTDTNLTAVNFDPNYQSNPLDGSLPYWDPNANGGAGGVVNLITEIDVTASVTSPLTICDGSAGCTLANNYPTSTFLPQTPFTIQWLPANGNGYEDANTLGANDLTILTISDVGSSGPGGGSGVPEPATLVLLIGGALALGGRRVVAR